MSNYTIALAGLQNTSRALDTVSNNIANANTVGYKAGEYLFADQFIKAVNPGDAARAGMGSQTLGVRRAMTQGTINNSQNPLDMAISGDGMFVLAKGQGIDNQDPTSLYFTRNGQFRLNTSNQIVNENGMNLMGWKVDVDGNPILGDLNVIDMPPEQMFQKTTSESSLNVVIDSRSEAYTSTSGVAFDPNQPTYNSKTTQIVYDPSGNTHSLEVYYRRISADTQTISYDSVAKGWTYQPSDNSIPDTLGTQKVTINGGSIVRVDTAPNYSDVVPSAGSSGTTLTLKNNIPTSVVSGMKVFRNGIDTGITTTAAGTATDATAVGTATTVTLSSALSLNAGDAISFYPATGTLNMTLIAPDGTEIPVTGASNKELAGTTFNVVTENVEVYASLDGHFYDMSGSGATANWDITPQTTGLGYKPISKISFWGGRNIDGLIEDPSSGNPAFHTVTKLTTTVTQASGAVEAIEFNLDLTDTKLMAADFQVTASVQDGEPATRLTNVSIDSTGRLIGVYGNGKQFIAAQVALAHFDNYEGLIPVGENAFAQSVDSGTIGSEGTQLGVAGQGVFGDIKSLALESSNVDLANELVKLMVLQRAYTANSQSMRATDQLIRDTLQMSN